MNLLVNTVARFLPKREFHVDPRINARATLTAGYPRQGDGSKVLRGIFVAVVFCATVFAGPLTYTKRQAVTYRAADVAGLRGREPAVCYDHSGASERSFVGELAKHFGHRRIHNGLGEVPIRDHAIDVQILDTDITEPLDHRSGQLVRNVLTNIGYPRVQSPEFDLGFCPVLTTLHAAVEFLVELPELELMLTQAPGCFDSLPGREHSEIDEPEVHTNRCLGFATMWIDPRLFDLYLNREIPPVRTFGEARGEYLSREPKVLAGTHPTELGDADFATIETKGSGFDGKGISTTTAFFESWISGLLANLHAAKKVSKGVAKVLEGVVGNGPWQFFEPSHIAVLAVVDFGVEFSPIGFFSSRVHLLPTREAKVPSETSCARTTLEKRCLDVVWVEPDSLSENHDWGFSINRVMACRITAATDTSCRRVSNRRYESMVGENDISWQTNFTCFLGGCHGSKDSIRNRFYQHSTLCISG